MEGRPRTMEHHRSMGRRLIVAPLHPTLTEGRHLKLRIVGPHPWTVSPPIQITNPNTAMGHL